MGKSWTGISWTGEISVLQSRLPIVFSSYCFVHGTTSLKYNGKELETVGPLSGCVGEESDCLEHHPHYMWVPIVTLAQAAISFLPHYLWYYWEGEDYS